MKSNFAACILINVIYNLVHSSSCRSKSTSTAVWTIQFKFTLINEKGARSSFLNFAQACCEHFKPLHCRGSKRKLLVWIIPEWSFSSGAALLVSAAVEEHGQMLPLASSFPALIKRKEWQTQLAHAPDGSRRTQPRRSLFQLNAREVVELFQSNMCLKTWTQNILAHTHLTIDSYFVCECSQRINFVFMAMQDRREKDPSKGQRMKET